MEIPIQITDKEDVSVDLLKRSLEDALYRSDVEPRIPTEYTGVRGFYPDNIKIRKLAYAAIEEFNLPVVRTWYKYGQYEPYDRLRPKSLTVGPSSDEAYIPSKEKIPVTEEHLIKYFLDRGLQEIFSQDLFDFLTENYIEWEPDPYTDAYLSSTNLIKLLERIGNHSRREIVNDISETYDDFKDISLDLRYHINRIDTFDEGVESHFKGYLTSLDQTLIKIEENSELSKDQMESLEQSRIIYHEYILPWMGIQISLDKAEGPKKSLEAFDKSGEEILRADKTIWRTQLKGWNTDLQEKGLIADYSTVRSAGPEPAPSIRLLHEAAFENS